MNDLRRAGVIACVLLVLLRLSIGWQFLYEGLWKYASLETANPWSAEGYLRNAQGPFRDFYRGMTGDPDELNWLDYDTMSADWDRWRDRFAQHYTLDEKQQQQLNELLDGPGLHLAPLKSLPETATFVKPETSTEKRLAQLIKYDPKRGLLAVQARVPLLPSEAAILKGMAPDNKAYVAAIERLETLSRRLSFRQRLAALLKGDPDRVGVLAKLEKGTRYEPEMGTAATESEDVQNIRYGEIQVYKDMLADYDRDLEVAQTDFQRDHLEKTWQKIQAKRGELVGPVKALDAELKQTAYELLTTEQRGRGALPPENTPGYRASQRAMWGLLILGTLLLLGFGTRIAAVAGAVMLISFYLVVPPWPGVPEPPGPEHSLFINKNIIEAIALLAIAALPTGSWFGLDGVVRWLFGRKRSS